MVIDISASFEEKVEVFNTFNLIIGNSA